MAEEKKKGGKGRIVAIVVIVLLLIGIFGGSGDDETTTDDTQDTAITQTTDEEEASEDDVVDEEEASEDDAVDEETVEEEPEVTTYSAGSYKVGSDIPAGLYKLTAQSYGYFAVYPDVSSQEITDIIYNANFEDCQWVSVSDGQLLEVSRATFVAAEDVEATLATSIEEGNGLYKVGVDIPAGEYSLQCTSDTLAYYAIYNEPGDLYNIQQNDNFENNAYVTVAEGQYLELARCSATLSE